MSSQLEADVKKDSSRLWWCSREGKNYSLWFDPLNMVPFAYDCWEDNIRLSYDFKERRTKDAPGVQVREVGFDNISSLRFSSKLSYPFCKSITSQFLNNFHLITSVQKSAQIFNALINALVLRGYKENVSLRAAPYDWRRAPCK